jgi:hypothetical protein
MNLRALLLLGVLGIAAAHADTNLPVACVGVSTDLTGKPIKDCPYANQKFIRATEATWVRTCAAVDTSTCTQALMTWQHMGPATGTERVEVCTVEKTAGDAAAGTGGSCQAPGGSTWSGMKQVAKYEVAIVPPLPPAATFTATPSSGDSPLNVTLAWNIPGMGGAAPCQASGDWTGPRAAVGTEALSSLMKDSSFTLTCVASKDLAVLVTWKPPTQNTDGTPLTGIASYNVHYGQSPNVLADTALAAANATSLIVKSYYFKPGKWYFAMSTKANDGTLSDQSNVIAIDLVAPPPTTAQPFTGTVKVTVKPKPLPPADVAVKQVDSPANSGQVPTSGTAKTQAKPQAKPKPKVER